MKQVEMIKSKNIGVQTLVIISSIRHWHDCSWDWTRMQKVLEEWPETPPNSREKIIRIFTSLTCTKYYADEGRFRTEKSRWRKLNKDSKRRTSLEHDLE